MGDFLWYVKIGHVYFQVLYRSTLENLYANLEANGRLHSRPLPPLPHSLPGPNRERGEEPYVMFMKSRRINRKDSLGRMHSTLGSGSGAPGVRIGDVLGFGTMGRVWMRTVWWAIQGLHEDLYSEPLHPLRTSLPHTEPACIRLSSTYYLPIRFILFICYIVLGQKGVRPVPFLHQK